MFEKEAEEYIKTNNLEWELECHRTSPIGEVKHAFLAGATFGYNKAKEEGKVVVEHFEAYGQCRDSRRIASLEAKNEKLKEQNNKAKGLIEKLLIVSCNSEILIQYPNCKEVLEARVALEQFLREVKEND